MSAPPVPKSPIDHAYAKLSNSIRLHYAESGKGNEHLVILLHGFPEYWYSWRHQLPVLGEEYHVVAPDLRGYNLSDKPSRVEAYRVSKLREDVIALVNYFGADRATLVGHDWGAVIAWSVAHKSPERVARLVVMQVPPAAVWHANMSVKQMLRSWYMLFFQLPRIPEWAIRRENFASIDRTFKEMVVNKSAFSDEDVVRYKEALKRPGALTATINYYRANLKRFTSESTYSGERVDTGGPIPMPTLFIFGEKDFAIVPDTVRGVDKYVTGPYRELRLPECGHWVQNEAAAVVNKALLEFFQSTEV